MKANPNKSHFICFNEKIIIMVDKQKIGNGTCEKPAGVLYDSGFPTTHRNHL